MSLVRGNYELAKLSHRVFRRVSGTLPSSHFHNPLNISTLLTAHNFLIPRPTVRSPPRREF